MEIPKSVKAAIEKLESAGYEAYLVGGCVRDSMLRITPKDYDIATSAKPDEVMKVFEKYQIVPTGIRHGTVTVFVEEEELEITTYRTEGVYRDFRHPDTVEFVSFIEKDLARRDFTLNAIAYHPKRRYVDPFSGAKDIEKRLIRTVGLPSERFFEDPLRILRALRFASSFGFEIERETADAAKELRYLLKKVAGERIFSEMSGILCGRYALQVLLHYPEIIAEAIPEILPTVGFLQQNPYHRHTIYDHTARVVSQVPEDDVVLRWAALLHDIGKPGTFTIGEDGLGHFYGHAGESVHISRNILRRFGAGNDFSKEVLCLVKYHDVELRRDKKLLRRWLSKLGDETLFRLLKLRRADAIGTGKNYERRVWATGEMERMVREILSEESCFSLKDLAISGRDLLESGLGSSPQIGTLLQRALDGVLEERVPNRKDALLEYLGIK